MIQNDAARTAPADITAAVLASFDGTPSPRTRELMQSLVRHLHAFAAETGLTQDEWRRGIAALTATGRITDERRQEFILWSDVLGLSMFVDALAHPLPAGATESTVLGPFYVPDSPLREYGANIAEQAGGTPTWVYGRVLDALTGEPLAGAELDVWQNADNRLYAVQDPDAPEEHLRGRFATREDGSYGFLAVRPTPYPIPDDGPVGQMLTATGRHPWRPAHIHMIVRADGYQTLVTHIFDRESEYLESDTVFAVKPSLLRTFQSRQPDDPERPPGVEGEWCSLECTLALAPGEAREASDPGRTA
ncbi:MAG: intradiol ring-cleavage dioxygenase [Solirubrobacterales bacterium]|nr:intradiol ring-cleavage dioxygenase [Solirubrobacterales bacterium]